MSLRITPASSAHAPVATCTRGKETSKLCASTAKKRRWPRTSSSMKSSHGLSAAKVGFNKNCVKSTVQSNIIVFWYLCTLLRIKFYVTPDFATCNAAASAYSFIILLKLFKLKFLKRVPVVWVFVIIILTCQL